MNICTFSASESTDRCPHCGWDRDNDGYCWACFRQASPSETCPERLSCPYRDNGFNCKNCPFWDGQSFWREEYDSDPLVQGTEFMMEETCRHAAGYPLI